MSTLMIALEDAQKAIRSIIEEYDRALKAEREAVQGRTKIGGEQE